MFRLQALALLLTTLSLASACDNRTGAGPSCTWQSSSSSGGICRTDVLCSGTQVAASCTDAECSCVVSGTPTGERFPADGFCAASESEQTRRVGASCATSGPADAGSTGEFAPYCATSPVVAGATCTSSAEGDRCPANVYCDACGRSVMTSCVCAADSLGYSFACADPCGSCAMPDGGTPVPADAGPPTSCLADVLCIGPIDGAAGAVDFIASLCSDLEGALVAGCESDHHARCVVAADGYVVYMDRTTADYDEAAMRDFCNDIGGTFTP